MAARRHGPTMAAPSCGQAWHRRAQVLQHHQGEAHGRVTMIGSPAQGESPRIHVSMCAGELEASGVGDEDQIDSEDLVRRTTAKRTHLISPAEMAGGSRRNSATATVTRVARARGKLGFRERE
jgi:mRNA-degrading endonuclease toxin of MazEF toxin-antitoxin module